MGYDKNSPANLVYYPEKENVQKHTLVKFRIRERNTNVCHTQGSSHRQLHPKVNDNMNIFVDDKVGNIPNNDVQGNNFKTFSEQTESTQLARVNETVRRNPLLLQSSM